MWKADCFILGASRLEAGGSIFTLRTSFYIHGLALPKQKGCRKKKCRLAFFLKKRNYIKKMKHFFNDCPLLQRYLNVLFRKGFETTVFKKKKKDKTKQNKTEKKKKYVFFSFLLTVSSVWFLILEEQ